MFANFLRLITRQPTAYQHAFVREVEVTPGRTRDQRVQRLLLWGWIVILLKCLATFWLIQHYRLPFNGWWIAAPSLLAAVVCSYLYRPRR
jgi:hypothetical protein